MSPPAVVVGQASRLSLVIARVPYPMLWIGAQGQRGNLVFHLNLHPCHVGTYALRPP
jgi:hypothetical protein